jgi:uncharacterized protein YbbC (DUF1343 family)/CubicO group peptidase (beta-lactamase class C family)
MRKKSYAICLLILCLFANAAIAQKAKSKSKSAATKPHPAATASSAPIANPELDVIDGIVNDEIAAEHIHGAVVLVGHDGKIIFRKAYGMRSIEPTREPMTIDTIFDMASLTKPLATGLSVMKLFENGEIRLDDAVAHYIPEFGQNGKDQITVRQLLTHYSGLRPDLDLSTPWQGYDEAMRRIWAEKPVNPPGARFVYSDINFEVLGEMVRRVSKMPLDKFAESHVYAPLGLTHTGFLPPKSWLPKIAPTQYADEQMATPVGAALPMMARHEVKRGVVHDPTADRMGGVAGHAGLFSCADDVAVIAQSLLDRKSVISGLTIDKMIAPAQPPNQTQLRGIAWDIDTSFSTNRGGLLPIGSYGHTGFTGTSLWIDPATDTYIIILGNHVHPHGKGTSVALRAKIATAVAARLHLNPSEEQKARVSQLSGYNELMAGYRKIPARNGVVLTGIDVLEQDNFRELRGADPNKTRVVGIMTNQSGLDIEGRRTIDVLASAPGIKLAAIFSPEHGIFGAVDTTDIGNSVDKATGVTVYSVYGDSAEKRRPPVDILKTLDAVIIDVQDVGARFYTYETTMGYFLEAAAKAGTEVIVLDRPNPVTGVMVQGPVSDASHLNFVDYHTEPIRHGMTMGELAKMFNGERHINAKLTVVPMQGWQRGDWFDATSLTWVNPSPNLRDMDQTALYTGVCIIEGTNVSVGRGTDTPFQVFGAPWIKPRDLAQYLNARQIAGVRFVPAWFTPAQGSKLGGQKLGGVQIVLVDRSILDAPQMGLELASALLKLYPKDFDTSRMIHLLGNDAALAGLLRGDDPRRIAAAYDADLQKFIEIRQKYLIYGARERQ